MKQAKREEKKKATDAKQAEKKKATDVKQAEKKKATDVKQVKRDDTWHKISPNYNTTFPPTRAALYFPKPVEGWATIDNCKDEGWTVGIKLLVDIKDYTSLLELQEDAVKLGMTIDQVMTLLKDQLENCLATICIESDINKNTAIQKFQTK